MTHDIDTPKTQTEAPAIALSSSSSPETTTPAPPASSVTTEDGYVMPQPPDDMPLFIGDLLPGLRDAMYNARMAYHRGDPNGQDILYAQAEALDALFVRILDRATAKKNSKGEDIPNYLHTEFINMALRTQRHCRKTIETVAVLREREKLAIKLKRDEYAKNYKRLAAQQERETVRALQETTTMDPFHRPENGER
jgi:hypothetical protein